MAAREKLSDNEPEGKIDVQVVSSHVARNARDCPSLFRRRRGAGAGFKRHKAGDARSDRNVVGVTSKKRGARQANGKRRTDDAGGKRETEHTE
jgi:hypothetical protein